MRIEYHLEENEMGTSIEIANALINDKIVFGSHINIDIENDNFVIKN